jgi:hypothetical protein
MSTVRDLKMARALESIPLPALPEDYYSRLGERLERESPVARPGHRRLLIALAVGILIAVILVSVALAGGFKPLFDSFDPLHDTFWPENGNGQTFGSSGRALSPGDEPDLIAVASDGKRGYCYKTDLDGPPPPASLSPEDVEVLNGIGLRGYAIPKYESDGATRIGVFWLGAGSAGGSGGMAGRYETSADVNGTLITTTEAPGGAITITREWLDGRTTTHSAEHDPSLSRLKASERPTTWRDITFWFRDDGLERHGHTSSPPVAPPWLAKQMSAVARSAGDAGATARWTLTYRRCAAPLEGDAAPTDETARYEPVWIAVLHGDFGWAYLLLDEDSHEVIAQGASAEPFDTSQFHLQGRTQLPAD